MKRTLSPSKSQEATNFFFLKFTIFYFISVLVVVSWLLALPTKAKDIVYLDSL